MSDENVTREVVVVMVVLLVATLGLLVAAALAFWPSGQEGADRARPAPGPVREVEPPALDSLEGVLATQLITGDITRLQYRHALERIAGREERRRPLAVPRDESPGTRP